MNQTEQTSEELLNAAVASLQNDYDVESDMFFVVVTKGAKVNDPVLVEHQVVIGEIGFQATMVFIWQIIKHFAGTFKEHPFTFITRNVIAPFIRQEEVDIQRRVDAARVQAQFAEGEESPMKSAFIKSDLTVEN